LKRRIADLRGRQQQLRAKLASPTSEGPAPADRSHGHPERSEGSGEAPQEILRFAQNDNDLPALPEQLVLDLGGASMVLRLVPAGEFLMGSADAEEHYGESPQHRVCFAKPFYLGQCPVTQAQWMAVMGSNPSAFRGDANLPVERVSWLACQEFCLKVSERVGRIVRLPSEAEWEYACRAGTTSAFFWGNTLTPELANCRTGPWSKVCLDKPTQTTPVASYTPNAWGFYDMHGNVAEWCEDEFDGTYEGAPTDGTARITPDAEGVFRVTRGGSHWHYYTACRSAGRSMCRVDADEKTGDPLPTEMRHESRGFRVVSEGYSSGFSSIFRK
jgi:formylglycine-generating enzyme required for sulfatase activity